MHVNRVIVLAILSLTAWTSENQAGIIVEAWGLSVAARDPTVFPSGPVEVGDGIVTLPFDVQRVASHGSSQNTTSYDFDQNGDNANFLFGFNHIRAAFPDSFVENTGSISFSMPASSPTLGYEFSGGYTASNSQILEMTVELRDLSAGVDAFYNRQWSQFTSEESFTLGELGGDFESILQGKLNGDLTPGHSYRLSYRYLTLRSGTVGTACSANGSLEFAITPEPHTLALLLLGTGLIVRFRFPGSVGGSRLKRVST
jgi:hypothetical protein